MKRLELEGTRTIDVEPQASQTVAMLYEYWSIAVRRKWVILSVVGCCVLAAWALCQWLPKSYRSSTLLVAEDQRIPENFVQGMIVESNLEQRIFVVQQQIKRRALLEEIIKEFHLYDPPDFEGDQTGDDPGLEASIAGVREAIRVEMLVKGVPGSGFVGRGNSMGIDAFAISFAHYDPVTAMHITNRLASKFIEENVKEREQIAEGTSEFFENEVQRTKKELEKKEREINLFKSKHEGRLPSELHANLRALDLQQSDLYATRTTIDRLQDRLIQIERDIAAGGIDVARVSPGGTLSSDPFRRLMELKQKLGTLSVEVTDIHPDVIQTRGEIKKLEGEILGIYGSDMLKTLGERPATYVHELHKQRNELMRQIAEFKEQEKHLVAERQKYKDRVESVSRVEQELMVLNRDYENMLSNYRALLDKSLNARVAGNLEKREKGAQFRILDAANLPTRPESPNQRRIMALGLLIGCVAAGGVTILLEQVNPRFRRPEDIERSLGGQLIAVIPDFSLVYGRGRRDKFIPMLPASDKADPPEASGAQPTLRKVGGRAQPLDVIEMSLVAKWFPSSLLAEQYRSAAIRLGLGRTSAQASVISVTSAVKGEGKTTTLINLGYTLARDLEMRTLLVDCDFKYPVLHRYAQSPTECGLADMLAKNIPLDMCISKLGELPCHILPAGNCEMHPKELFRRERLDDVLAHLRQQFDYILINTPPILPLADMNVLAACSDVLVLVVRAGVTPQQVVKRALTTLSPDIPVHIILNGVGSHSLPYYMYEYVSNKVSA